LAFLDAVAVAVAAAAARVGFGPLTFDNKRKLWDCLQAKNPEATS
jgi:hypothetical protein